MRTHLSLLSFLAIYCAVANANDTLIFSQNENLLEQNVAAKILTEVYKQEGITLIIKPSPPARAEQLNAEGTVDGEVARISAYSKLHPELLQIPTPIYYLETGVFCQNKNLKLTKPEDLNTYSISTIRGVKHSDLVAKFAKKISLEKSATHSFEMLQLKRVDLAIDTVINGNYLVSIEKYKDVHLCGTIAKHELYHYLNPKQKNKFPFISAKIAAMAKSGQLMKLIKKYELKVLEEKKASEMGK